jgi:deoxyribonuclease V
MKYLKLHSWNVSYKKAVEIQKRLEKSIILTCAAKNVTFIAGADVSYLASRSSSAGTKKSEMFYASIVVFELKTMEMVEAVTASGKVDFPYIPGLLSFRESPILLKAFAKIKSTPDVIILDAQVSRILVESVWRLILGYC